MQKEENTPNPHTAPGIEDQIDDENNIIRIDQLSNDYKTHLDKFAAVLTLIDQVNSELKADPTNSELTQKLITYKSSRDENFNKFLELLKANSQNLKEYLEQYKSTAIEFTIANLDDRKRVQLRKSLKELFCSQSNDKFEFLKGNKSLLLQFKRKDYTKENKVEEEEEAWTMEDLKKEEEQIRAAEEKKKIEEFTSHPGDVKKIWLNDYDPYTSVLTVWVLAPFDFELKIQSYSLKLEYRSSDKVLKSENLSVNFTQLSEEENLQAILDTQNSHQNEIHVLKLDIQAPENSRFLDLNIRAVNESGQSPKPFVGTIQFPENYNQEVSYSITGIAKYGQLDSNLCSEEDKPRVAAIEQELETLNTPAELEEAQNVGLTNKPIAQSFKNMEGSKLEIQTLKSRRTSLAIVNRWQLVQWGEFVTADEDSGKIQLSQTGLFTPFQDMKIDPSLFCKVEVGLNFCVALSCLGNIYTWGLNQFGQLGHSDLKSRLKPTKIQFFEDKNIQIVDISTRNLTVLALTSKGQVYSWGLGQALVSGQPIKDRHDFVMNFEGDFIKSQDKPILISKNFIYDTDPVVKLSTGHDHSGFLTKSGKVYLWGSNLSHQVCSKKWACPLLPISQNIQEPIIEIELTEAHSYALSSGGKIYIRGGNYSQWRSIEAGDKPKMKITHFRAIENCIIAWAMDEKVLKIGPKIYSGMNTSKAQSDENYQVLNLSYLAFEGQSKLNDVYLSEDLVVLKESKQ